MAAIHLRGFRKLFCQPASHGQFAKNGTWEKAWSFHADNPPSTDEFMAYLKGVNEVAFELFFGSAFFGVRFRGAFPFIAELTQHCMVCMQISSDAISFISDLGSHPLCGELCHDVSHIEIGTVNAWKSFGTLTLPAPAQALADFDEFWSRITSSPVSRDVKNLKAVELVYADPLAHWVGFPISIQEIPYTLRKEMLLNVLHEFITNRG